MAGGAYEAGSVNARIILDTKEFDKALGDLKKDIGNLKGEFNSIKGVNKFTKQIDELKAKVKSLEEANNNLTNSAKNIAKSIKNQAQEATEAIKKVDKQTELFRKNFDRVTKITFTENGIVEGFKAAEKEADNAAKSVKRFYAAYDKNLAPNKHGIKADMILNGDWEEAGYKISEMLVPADRLKVAIAAIGQMLKSTGQEFNRFEEQGKKAIEVLTEMVVANERAGKGVYNKDFAYLGDNFNVEAEALKNVSKLINQTKLDWISLYKDANQYASRFYAEQNGGLSTYKQRIAETSAELRKFYLAHEKYYASVGAMSWKYWRQIRGSNDANNQVWNSDKTWNKSYFDAQSVGLQDYYKNIGQINELIAQFERGAMNSAQFKEQLLQLANALKTAGNEMNRFSIESDKIIAGMSRMAKANEVAAEISKISKELSHFSSLSGKNKSALSGLSQQITILKDKFRVLDAAYREGEITTETYEAEITKLAEKLKLLGASAQQTIRELSLSNGELSKTEGNARKAGKGITTFNNGIVQTAHSGRILSNTLYQIRGALLSLKMIATAMGGMAIWGFIMDIGEGIKQTFTAKNEMEAQLEQNAKVGASGINTFNRALDDTISRFAKINKYALGETVSSIGLEFELTSKQMEKSMDIVAMIQSEYVRAGRTSEEAALAVKDILQGEFQRLSRETGVGKEELLAYGWSGDKTDVDSLLNALDKAAKDRNWDLFAAKATSLNDVVQITKSRFEEFGADLLQSISPMVVGAFNTIVDALTGLQKGFEGLGSFGKNAVVGGGFFSGVIAISTALPMVTKGMGLADIATIGWGKSLATAALNLNKAEVAQQGFRKALAAVISGTTAAELEETRWSKAIMGRVLNVDQAVLKEKGYLAALAHHKMELKDITIGTKELELMSGKWHQKLAFLATDIDAQTAKNLKWHQSLRKVIFSWNALRIAMLGVFAISAIAWYTALADWADTTKKNIDGLNEVIDNGDEMLKDAEKSVNDYTNALSNLTEGTKEYKKAQNNLKVAQANKRDIEMANKLAKEFKAQNEEREKSIENSRKAQMAATYQLAGLDGTEASERASGWLTKVLNGQKAIAESEAQYEHRLYQSNQHMNERLEMMTEEERKSKSTLDYLDDYSQKALETAEHWKKFYQGDLTEGVYAILGEIKLIMTDIWYDPHFTAFWNKLNETWKNLKPTLDAIKNSLIGLGQAALDFFSTDVGQWVGGAALIGGAIVGIGYKIAPTLKSLKEFGSTLKGVLDKIKDWKKETGGKDSPTDKSDEKDPTGGIDGDIGGKGNGKFWGWDGEVAGILKNRFKSFVNNALVIAEGMALITEAVYLLQAPMWALGEVGKTFKAKEKSIKAGMEGLQLIAPTVIAILIPVMALVKVMDMWGSQIMNWKTLGATAVGIAAGLFLVAEAILMLNAPLLAIASLGYAYDWQEGAVKKGAEAMKIVADSLQYLLPFVPVFIAGIAIGVALFSGGGTVVGGIALAGAAAGIAIGLLLVSEAILMLKFPLAEIANLGKEFSDLGNVEQGAKAMKLAAESMGYVEDALNSLVGVQWDMIAANIGNLLGVNLGTTLDDLVKDDGFLQQLSNFADKFNQMDFKGVAPEKAKSLKAAAESMNAVNDALSAAKTAIDNLPQEFKNGGNGGANPLTSYDMETNTTTASTTDATNYFDQLKQPLEQLGNFIDWFNDTNGDGLKFPDKGINTGKLTSLTQSAEMIGQVNDAVNKVKETMGGIVDAGWSQNMANDGIGAAVMGLVAGLAPGGDTAEGYVSSLGSSLKEMENVVQDIVTFNSNIDTLVSGGNGDGNGDGNGGESDSVNAMANMIVAVEQAISSLNTTLASAVPEIKTNAQAIGTGIRDGIKEGIGDLSQIILPPFKQALEEAKNNAGTYGKGIGWKLTDGFKQQAKIKEATQNEIELTLTYLDGKKQDFYDKGAALGDALSRGYQENKGLDHQSPGRLARATFAEMGYIEEAFDTAITTIPTKAAQLGASLAESYTPQIATDIGLTDMTTYESGLAQIGVIANDTNLQTSAAFTNMDNTTSLTMGNMTTTINGAFTNIDQNATTSYGRIVNTTRTSLKNMQDQTTKNITAIRTSWKGMQDALIASAEHIRSETSSKIHQLESNMASFWNKIQNPANLLSAGNPMMTQHTKPRSRPIGISSSSGSRRMLAAGSPSLGQRITGISDRFKSIGSSDSKMRERFVEYLQCLLNGGVCAAGNGWHFDWVNDIRKVFMEWHTHFGEIYDPYLRVGKFENDDFPVRGIAPIALNYIEDAIGRTKYDFYWDYRYSPLEAWNRGAFNCMDGARLAIAFANAFGFGGGEVRHTTWDGLGHGYAYIPGLGVIDATAIQGGYGRMASKVSYSAGSHTITQNASRSAPPQNSGNTIEGNVVFEIHIDGDVEDAEEKGKEIADAASKKFIEMFRRSPSTGL